MICQVRVRTFANGIIKVTILAYVAGSTTVVVLAGAVARDYVADLGEGAQWVAFTSCKLKSRVRK